LGQDPAVRAVLEMPNAERWTSDLLNSSTEQFVQSRGMGEMYQWSQTEPEGTQAAAAPEGSPPTVSAEKYLNSPKFTADKRTLEAMETEEDKEYFFGIILQSPNLQGVPESVLRDQFFGGK
jgi:hypothetical protein